MNLGRLIGPLVAVALIAAACAGSDANSNASAAAEPEPTPIVTTSATPDPTPIGAGGTPQSTPPPIAAEPTTEPAAAPTTASVASGEPGSGCGVELTPGTSTVVFDSGGLNRVYELLIPIGYDPDAPTPVVLNFHGLGSNGRDQLSFSDYPRLADLHRFIVVAPTGLPTPPDVRNSWELTPDQDPDRDDVQFANDLLDHVIESACIDQTRVYATGMSAGGYFTSVLVCEMSERIAAAASIAGLTHADDCSPALPVPYIAFHGTDDQVVPYAGGGTSALLPGVVIPLFELVIPDEFAEFAADDSCAPDPPERTLSAEVTSFAYTVCDGATEATFYRIDGGGHTWPGSRSSLLISESIGLGYTTDEIDASAVSWEFFSRHSLEP